MSIYPILCDYVALPTSQIKSPGSLLKHTDSQTKCESRQEQIQKLLDQFKAMTEMEASGASQEFDVIRPRASLYSFPEPSFNETMLFPELKQVIRAIKLKSFSDEIDSLIRKSKQILALYGIDLVIETNEQHHDELYNLLKCLVSELSIFTESFIKKLLIKKFVVCDIQDLSYSRLKHSTEGTNFFTIDAETQKEISSIFGDVHKIFLDRILMIKPQIVDEWVNSLSQFLTVRMGNQEEDFKATYIAFVQNSSNPHLRGKVEKLKLTLKKLFPDDFSEDWFKVLVKRRSKGSKTCFFPSTGTIMECEIRSFFNVLFNRRGMAFL